MRRTFLTILLTAVLFGAFSISTPAQNFQPDLGLARELIVGDFDPDVSIPTDSPAATTYPIGDDRPQPLLTEVPGQPFRQVQPPPQARHWWKYPIYAVIGFPRDLADAAIAQLRFIPFISPLVYVGYEVVPTQALLRDPRDWHRWDTWPNRHDHGFYKGNSWGYFPSWNMWEMTYPSEEKARRNEQYNEQLRQELNELNRGIEQQNQAIAQRKLHARVQALEAIEAGDGAEAVKRMVPYHLAYPNDDYEGAFALFATALALHQPDGPDWTGPVLWRKLLEAQPTELERTEALLDRTIDRFPGHPSLNKALVYTRLLLDEEDDALEAAMAWQAAQTENEAAKRLAFETALSARQSETARRAWEALDQDAVPEWERRIVQARLDLLDANMNQALEILRPLQAQNPENAYLNYYVGCAELMLAEAEQAPVENFRQAFDRLELAALQAPGPALRRRAGEALAFARGVLAAFAEEAGE